MGCKQGKTSAPESTGTGFPTASQQASLSPQQKTLLRANTMDAEKVTPSPNSQEDLTIEKFMVKAELGEEAQNVEASVGPANYEPLVLVELEAEQLAQQEQRGNIAPAPSSFSGSGSIASGMRPPAAASLAVDRANQPDALQTAALNPLPSAVEARAVVSAVREALPEVAGASLPDARQSDESKDDATGRRLGVKLLAVSQSPGASLAVAAQKDAQQPSQSQSKKEGSGAGRKERQICCC